MEVAQLGDLMIVASCPSASFKEEPVSSLMSLSVLSPLLTLCQAFYFRILNVAGPAPK